MMSAISARTTWDDATDDRLKQMVENGLSNEQIASALGMSRGAISGRMHRKGLRSKSNLGPGGHPIQKQNLRAANIVGKREGRKFDPVFRPARQPIDATAFDADAPKVSLVDLGRTHCRFPLGDPRDDGFGFCGHQRLPGYPYCSAHCERAYQNFMAVPA